MNDATPDSSAHANSAPLLAGGALVGGGAGLLGAGLIPWALGNALTPAPLRWILVAAIAAVAAIGAGTVVLRRGVRPPLTQRDRGLLIGAATGVALLVAGAWIGRALALLPRDTTALVVVPVASALTRDVIFVGLFSTHASLDKVKDDVRDLPVRGGHLRNAIDLALPVPCRAVLLGSPQPLGKSLQELTNRAWAEVWQDRTPCLTPIRPRELGLNFREELLSRAPKRA